LRILKKKRGFPFYEVNGEGNTKLLVFALNLPAMCHESMVSSASKSQGEWETIYRNIFVRVSGGSG
jgi:hypothetical protein